MNLKQIDKKFLARSSDAEDIQVARTDGSFVYDARGRKYIDFLSGWCVGNVGWGNAEIRGHIARSSGPDYVVPSFLYRPWGELAQLLAGITPGKLQKTYRATGGTEAVEIALQVAMVYTGRRKFVSLEGSYHGNSIGTVSVGASEDHEPFPNLLRNCLKVSPPLDAKAADKVERLLAKRDVAAFIMEPVSMSLGVLIPDSEFMTRLAKVCRHYGTLLIADEVACGFGRTGTMFASEQFDLQPDILCMAKAISGGYAPIGATITTAKIADAVRDDVEFYSTYGWHPRSVDVAIANVRWMIRNRRKLFAHVSRMSDLVRRRLSEMKFAPPAKLRIRGMAIGVESGDEDYLSEIVDGCQEDGLLIQSAKNVLTLFPPLTVEEETVVRALKILEAQL